MTGPVCLQGGREFTAGCRPMDARVVSELSDGGRPLRVVVVALAAAPGREHDTAAGNGVAHYRALGADAVAAPDARQDPAAAVATVRAADLVVLPGGSPSRLLTGLRGTAVGDALREVLAGGGGVSGSSAGAMVLGGWTVLPDRRGPGPDGPPSVVPALGVVPDVVVLPHWQPGARADWLRAVSATVPGGVTVLGLPEESGVLVEGRSLTAVGRHPTRLVREGADLPPGHVRHRSAAT